MLFLSQKKQKMNITIKEKLFQKALQFVENQIFASKQGIEQSQQAANDETKSSAGDKYETTRAMMQIEIENYTKRLAEAQKSVQVLQKIHFQDTYSLVTMGSLVVSNQGKFFMAIGVGKVQIDQEDFFIISQHSPVGQQFYHKKVGDEFVLNGRKFVILEIV